jgi:hypothetical protein
MSVVKTKKNHAISERSTPDKVRHCRQTQTPHPGEVVEATAAMVKRSGAEQPKQVRVEEVGAEGTAGTLLRDY